MRLIRDDIKAGAFLNKRIKCPTDYKQEECYYYGNPIQLAFSFHDRRKMSHGWLADFSIASGDNFTFSRCVFKEVLALFFNNKYYGNNIRLQALISPENEQALRLARLAGMKIEGRMRDVASDGDRMLLSILKREFDSRYGRHIQQT